LKKMKIDYRAFFKEWKNWGDFEPRIDGINGVYAFRLKTPFGRIKGESNLLYIGMVLQNPEKNKRPGIWHRLMNYRQNIKGGPEERLKTIENYLGSKSFIEYAYEICGNPRETEKSLLGSYYRMHLEYPPVNKGS
jgi:hypothetical protein